MKTEAKFTPFPIGTVRGPYLCGIGQDPNAGIQFAVQTKQGWRYFIGQRDKEALLRKDAENFSKRLLLNKTKP